MAGISELKCWVVTEGIIGTENQCLGVAQALGATPEIKRIQLRAPWKQLSPYLGFEMAASFSPALAPPWPDLVLAGGRKAIAAARYIHKQSQGKSFVTFIQDPRVNPAQFDLVAIPQHDPTRGDNVIVTTAAPNKITADLLEIARERWQVFNTLPGPRVAVLIGGDSQTHILPPARMKEICAQLQALNAGLMMTTSRRTGKENYKILEEALGNKGHFIWDGQGDNPYLGMLAWADFILVTADSTSMLSEACSTGKPVYMISMDKRGPYGQNGRENRPSRIDKLHENLRQSGCLREFGGILETWSYEPLRDAEIVAQEIRKRMNLL